MGDFITVDDLFLFLFFLRIVRTCTWHTRQIRKKILGRFAPSLRFKIIVYEKRKPHLFAASNSQKPACVCTFEGKSVRACTIYHGNVVGTTAYSTYIDLDHQHQAHMCTYHGIYVSYTYVT